MKNDLIRIVVAIHVGVVLAVAVLSNRNPVNSVRTAVPATINAGVEAKLRPCDCTELVQFSAFHERVQGTQRANNGVDSSSDRSVDDNCRQVP